MSDKKVIWKMISSTEYEGTLDDYIILLFSGKPNRWYIKRDGSIVENCFKYPPMNESANGKIQSEKILLELIKYQNGNK